MVNQPLKENEKSDCASNSFFKTSELNLTSQHTELNLPSQHTELNLLSQHTELNLLSLHI